MENSRNRPRARVPIFKLVPGAQGWDFAVVGSGVGVGVGEGEMVLVTVAYEESSRSASLGTELLVLVAVAEVVRVEKGVGTVYVTHMSMAMLWVRSSCSTEVRFGAMVLVTIEG